MTLTTEEQVDIISRAWGAKARGYCFFPTMRGDAEDKRERTMSFRNHRAFYWPREREAIIQHIESNQDNDVFWCPMLFEKKERHSDWAKDDGHALWADLDEADPRDIEERYRPTVAWETSPGRYQALWIMRKATRLNMSFHGMENHRLTMYLAGDRSGWDTTQLLRLPQWPNHKPDRRAENGGEAPLGQLLWNSQRRYSARDFDDLPEVEQVHHIHETILEAQLDEIDRDKLLNKVKLKLKPHIREYIYARTTPAKGQRSEILWQLERELADIGCSIVEIIAIVRGTVWNKYEGRADELHRLTLEAGKAIDERAFVEVPEERPDQPERLKTLFANVKPPNWLIQDIWNVGACGFIAGEPKSFKSWFGLDMALSIATGYPFLGYFPVRQQGPVLYIQEEDSLPLLKARYDTLMDDSKQAGYVTHEPDGTYLNPKPARDADPEVYAIVRHGFQITDEGWAEWLDRQLTDRTYKALIVDPLLMVQGNIKDHYNAGEMTQKVYRPLKIMSEKYGVAVILIHHMRKGNDGSQRGGQMMLGSVANHAWAEDSIYVTHRGRRMKLEVESKFAAGGTYEVAGVKRKKGWSPSVNTAEREAEDDGPEIRQATPKSRTSRLLQHMKAASGPQTTKQIASALGITVNGAHQQLQRHVARGTLTRSNNSGRITYALNT